MTILKPPNQLTDILKLLADYQELNANLNEKNKLDVEKLKLEYVCFIELNLKRDLHLLSSIADSGDAESLDGVQNNYKKTFYYVLMILGTINDAAKSYLFGSALILLIPHLSLPIRVILSVFYIIFEAILFQGFEVVLLKDALGVTLKTHLQEYINVNIEQIRTITRINRLLVDIQVSMIEFRLYRDYLSIVTILNDDLHKKLYSQQLYEDSIYKKLLKIAFLGFGIISNVGGSYFMVNAVLTVWAPALLGTPLGWAIIGLAIIVELGFYYAMGATGVVRLFNSERDSFNILKKELGLFDKERLCFFSRHLKKEEFNLKPRVLHDVETQTDFEEKSSEISYCTIGH